MNRRHTRAKSGLLILLIVGGMAGSAFGQLRATTASGNSNGRESVGRFVNNYCVECHNGDDKVAGLDLEALSLEDLDRHPQAWENVVRRLDARQMPPAGWIRPNGRTYDSIVSQLAGSLDRIASEHPSPGRTDTF